MLDIQSSARIRTRELRSVAPLHEQLYILKGLDSTLQEQEHGHDTHIRDSQGTNMHTQRTRTYVTRQRQDDMHTNKHGQIWVQTTARQQVNLNQYLSHEGHD